MIGSIKKLIVPLLRLVTIRYQLLKWRLFPKKARSITELNAFDLAKHRFILIYASFQQYPNANAKALLSVFRKKGAYIVFVTNHPNPKKGEVSDEVVDVFIDNNSHGRDIGQFRTATLYIQGKYGEDVTPKIIYANDSIFFLDRGDSSFVDQLLDERSDFVGTFENSGHSAQGEPWFISSWLFSVSKGLFNSQEFRRYFLDYRSIDNKLYAVRAGEQGLSRIALKYSERVKAIYSNEYLLKLLATCVADSGAQYASGLLSENIRGDFEARFRALPTDDELVRFVSRNLYQHSPAHVFAIFLLCETNYQFVKKDMFWSGAVQYDQLMKFTEVLSDVASRDQVAEMLSFFLRKGRLADASLTIRTGAAIGLQ
ncbi:hypothetical protein [Paraburkholderia tropica]|uniref:hypothetical protein n=1 Tax=Paraburkholderia tropica TaxID=92647 RepID=UPI003D2B0958